MKPYTLLFSLAILFGCSSQKTTQSIPGLSITSHSLVVPIIKGVATNPVQQISIEINGDIEVDYKLSGTLDANAIAAIEKLEVYADSGTVFSTKNKIGSVIPTIAEFEIPLTGKLKKGRNNIWLSATLKPSADIDSRITVHANHLVIGNRKLLISALGPQAKRLAIAIRKGGEDGVHTYRIPGITITGNGTLIAVYDIRYNNSKDLPENIDVGMSRSTDSGRTWAPMQKIMDMGAPHENNGIGDPAILYDPATKKIWVAALWSKGNRSIAGSKPGISPDTTGQFVLVSSDDDGKTWSEPYTITPQIKNPAWHLYFNGPGSGIVMQNGTLVFPSQYWDENKMPHSAIIYSNDNGKTWKSGIGAKSNTTESQVAEISPGVLMLSMRDNRGKFRSVAVTSDMGSSWKEHSTSYNTLIDPVCMASLVNAKVRVNNSLKDVLFFSNPASNTRPLRDSMTIKASLDQGNTWASTNQLLIDERNFYGYSVLVRISETMIGLLYEGQGDLYFIRVPVSEIIK